MAIRLLFSLFLMTILFSCQTIIRYRLGIKDPEIEKEKTVIGLIEKNKIKNGYFLKKEKIADAYIGEFPKIYIFDKEGYQVILPNCYQMIAENLNGLVDTIPNKLSGQSFRDKFVEETIQRERKDLLSAGEYDYEVFFYWSVWLGKYNFKKLNLAQETINSINKRKNAKKLILIPVNFDFIEESGWTEQSVEIEMKHISSAQKMLKAEKQIP